MDYRILKSRLVNDGFSRELKIYESGKCPECGVEMDISLKGLDIDMDCPSCGTSCGFYTPKADKYNSEHSL